MEALRQQAFNCTDCDLACTRRHVVFGEGNPYAEVVLVGEGPGEWEDRTGRPFVGRAGKLLDAALKEAGLRREELYITNIVKCRATSEVGGRLRNRPPRVSEVRACRKWLEAQLRIIHPEVLVCIGGPAASLLLHKGFKMTDERGKWFPDTPYAPLAMAVLHPAYVLRQDGEDFLRARELLIEDLRKVRERL
ncbi:MAG TPA: uracil-DNA glycosylase [Candidatus Latescibacteria bacterium]|nr:uracil-DNA glycosylase [Candidatus Latescibacterota bacterium]